MNPQDDNLQLPQVQADDDSADSDAIQQIAGDPQMLSPTSQQNAATDNSGNPPVANDVDLIEKAWVEKAKNIVNNTMGDPHSQTEEINRMKADYIKKRYNKDIKASE